MGGEGLQFKSLVPLCVYDMHVINMGRSLINIITVKGHNVSSLVNGRQVRHVSGAFEISCL
jgi:hypothetical protein